MWDETAIRRYEAWYTTPTGRFAFTRERTLLERLVAEWPRRDQRFLEIGCGSGLFLETFWESGFDVTGIDQSQAMIRSARERMGDRAGLHVGHADCLPFDDNEFDYTALLTVLEYVDDPVRVLEEARRVTRKGILVSFLNRNSCYYVGNGMRLPLLRRGMMRSARWYTPCAMRRLITQALGTLPTSFKTTLPGPKWTWRDRPPWNWINAPWCFGLVGAYGAVRIDLVGGKPLTPLLAFDAAAETS
ncbi:MAG: class I SAM-dependent methyltransferase [Desulfovibrionaceae bacterium]